MEEIYIQANVMPLQDISNAQGDGSKDARMQRRLKLQQKRGYSELDPQLQATQSGNSNSVAQSVQTPYQTAGTPKLVSDITHTIIK